MTIDIPDINFFAILISGVLATILGSVWYHPKVMGKQWAEASGINLEDTNVSPALYIISLTLWVISATFYAVIVDFMNVEFEGWYFALSCLLWVAFALPPVLMSSLFTGKAFEVVAIDASYHLAGYYIFAGIHILLG